MFSTVGVLVALLIVANAALSSAVDENNQEMVEFQANAVTARTLAVPARTFPVRTRGTIPKVWQ